MDKEDFLQLLIAEMENQNPLDPMDNTEYASQLAQFSSLEQLQNINDNLETSISANYTLTQSITNSMVSTLIGKDVKVSTDTITVSDQDEIQLGIDLSADAAEVEINIYNSSGTLVRTITEEDLESGEHLFTWDLTNDSGKAVSAGTYTFEITATTTGGSTLSDTGYLYGYVTGVQYSENCSYILVNGTACDVSDLYEIINADETE